MRAQILRPALNFAISSKKLMEISKKKVKRGKNASRVNGEGSFMAVEISPIGTLSRQASICSTVLTTVPHVPRRTGGTSSQSRPRNPEQHGRRLMAEAPAASSFTTSIFNDRFFSDLLMECIFPPFPGGLYLQQARCCFSAVHHPCSHFALLAFLAFTASSSILLTISPALAPGPKMELTPASRRS